jgi:hypothetical protein
MAYLGLQPNTPLLNTSTQTFSGNSVATQFTLARSVASASDLDVMIGSTLQRPFADYLAGNVSLQFISAPTTGTNNITVTYRGGALNSLDLTASTFNAGTVAAPSVVSLAANNTGIYWANASSISVTVSGTNRATFLANAVSVSADTGALTVDGGAGIDGNVNISGRVAIFDSTESTSVSTGSFKTAGGAGIVGNLNVGGDITCVGDFTVNGTFTTTGTDSLAVTDPFIFLANNNPGDTYDSGVITQFYDGANIRYSGYFRDITDAKYKLFTNLLTQPTTTVDTTDPSFQYTDLILANVSATGNVNATYFVGNGAALTGIATSATRIFNANSEVTIAAVNANVNMIINSSQIANVWSGGFSVVGAVAASTTVSATGNIIAGNVSTAGVITATGNITSAANVSAGNVLVGGAVSSVGNVTGGNIVGTTNISTTGSVVGGSLRTAGIVSATGDVYGNNFSATTDVTAGGLISAVGDITGGNIFKNGLAGSTTLINIGPATATTAAGTATFNTATVVAIANTSGTALSVAGNVTGANINTGGSATVTGNIVGGNISTAGLITATGNVTGGNIITSAAISAASVSASGTVIGAGNITGANFDTGGLVTATGNVTGGNIATAGLITVTGNVQAVGNVSGGNILTANLIQGTTVSATGNVIATANVNGGNLNAVSLSLSGNVISGIATTANIVGANIIATAAMSAVSVSASGTIVAVGNITGGNVLGGANVNATTHTGTTVSITGTVTAASVVGGVMTGSSISVTGAVTGAGITGTSLTVSTGAVTLGSIVNANANGVGNIGATGGFFNTVFAKATSAQYADLAEWYEADADYAPGTVLVFGGDREVTMAIGINDVRVAGVVSTNPAHIMNSGLKAPHVAALALTGRVPTLVVGPVAKGDMMVTAGGGRAQACAEPRMGSVIGKALQDHPGGQGSNVDSKSNYIWSLRNGKKKNIRVRIHTRHSRSRHCTSPGSYQPGGLFGHIRYHNQHVNLQFWSTHTRRHS